ncbi:DUF1993 domain-containing protein [Paraurantiacibacter namhicola]|uniref:DUF1993 domain-containing protein n=1 Tax=Paraurantiacibacter namhicola TaxID=645517 RepID=A0A1C7DAQ5_9SPHN|nr:DUF1993 domain-containing protein [Paraurantiacibacter namhicola]ANU08462.1 hypothetical protein A6F65_02177 [Paraurantiacibacter namhicola]
MSLTLHAAFVPNCLQILDGMLGQIDKAEAHCAEHGIDAVELLEARLHETMWALPHHVRSCWMHSAYTLDQVPTGEFTPDFTDLPADWAAMRAMIGEAKDRLAAATPEDMEGYAGTTVHFVLGGKKLMTFDGQDFVLSFNQPNFMFHAATFYDILRMKGVPLGKRDFLGPMRMMPTG